jgi:hypothetical protein
MKRSGKIALLAMFLGCGLASLRWIADPGPSARFEPSDASARTPLRERSETAIPPPRQMARPPAGFGGAYGQPDRGLSVSREEGLAHYALGAQLLELRDYYSAVSHLSLARDGLGDIGQICELLAIAYDQLNMTVDLLEIMPCLAEEARERPSASRLYDRLRRQVDVEVEFQVATSDHFVASFSTAGPSAGAIGEVLDTLERARREVEAAIGMSSMRLVPVVIYESGEFAAATDTPHWARGLYDGKIRIAVDAFRDEPDRFETLVTHEYVHALTHEYTGTRLPSWFREGLADNLARRDEATQDILTVPLDERGPLLAIEDLNGRFTELSKEMAIHAYRQSYWMVRNLVWEAGWDAVADLLRDLHENRELSFDEAFIDLYGESPVEYLDRWYGVTFR